MRSIFKVKNLTLFALLAATVFTTACTSKKATDGENTLTMSVSSEIKSLDSIALGDLYTNRAGSQIYEPLYTYHYLKRPLELIPALADGMPVMSKDGLTATIKIKKGLLFHDNEAFKDGKGREVVAEDFIYAWKRLVDPRNGSDGYWIFEGKIKGLNEWRDKVTKGEADYKTPIEGFTAIDSHTLQIKMIKPYYQLVYVLAMPYTAPTAIEAIDKYGKEYANNPVGTGPFMMKSWIRGNRLEMVRNPNWREELYPSEGTPEDQAKGFLADAGKKLPFVDKLVILEIVEDQTRWLNFMKGQIDFAGIPKDNYDTAIKDGKLSEEMTSKNIKLDIVEEPDLTYTAFNMEDPILGKNRYLRLAMGHAIDTETMIDKFYNRRAISAQSPIAPGIDGYDPNYVNPNKKFDLEKAKEYMKLAGYPDGKGLPEIEYSNTSSATSRQFVELFTQHMATIGIKIKVVTTSWPQFTEKLRKKKAQLWGIAWSGDYPDAQNFFQLLHSSSISPGPNAANYNSPEFDKLYDKALGMPPGPARTKVYLQMRDLAVKDAPWIFNTHRTTYTLDHEWVHNFKIPPISHDFVKYIRIDTAKRAEKKKDL
ncbi:MAG: ABC transporter substrate-binding protein [Bdellovibrionota bacterium]